MVNHIELKKTCFTYATMRFKRVFKKWRFCLWAVWSNATLSLVQKIVNQYKNQFTVSARKLPITCSKKARVNENVVSARSSKGSQCLHPQGAAAWHQVEIDAIFLFMFSASVILDRANSVHTSPEGQAFMCIHRSDMADVHNLPWFYF